MKTDRVVAFPIQSKNKMEFSNVQVDNIKNHHNTQVVQEKKTLNSLLSTAEHNLSNNFFLFNWVWVLT